MSHEPPAHHSTDAEAILRGVGGADNVASVGRCVTRLRLELRDASAADDDAVRAVAPVQAVVRAGGQYQVVVGQGVAELEAQVRALTARARRRPGAEVPAGAPATTVGAGAAGASSPWYRRCLDGFLALVPGVLGPLLWPLAGAGILKGYAGLLLHLGVLGEPGGTVAQVLTAAADGVLVLLPVGLAVTTARYLRASGPTAFALAAALLLAGLLGQAVPGPGPVDAAHGLIVLTGEQVPGAGSFVPVVVAVWLMGYVERWLRPRLPHDLADPLTPALTLLVMVPLLVLVLAPVLGTVTGALAALTTGAAHHAPWLLGAVLGGCWQLLVLLGLHWALVPLLLNELVETGSSPAMAVLLPAVLAQGAAVLGVGLRARRSDLRAVALPAARSAVLAGVTEPGLYALSVPLRRPLVAGCVGGAVGGALVLMAGGASQAFVLPSLVALPAYLTQGSPWLVVGGTVIAMAVALLGTVVLPLPEDRVERPGAGTAAPQDPARPGRAGAAPAGSTGSEAPEAPGAPGLTVLAPVAGRLIDLSEVPDEVLGGGMMGPGTAVVPEDGHVVAPVSGTVSATVPSLHGWVVRSDEGVEVLVHVGVGTVSLHGEGFTARAALGQRVAAGDPLVDVDLPVLRAAGLATATAVLVISREHAGSVVVLGDPGPVRSGQPVLGVGRTRSHVPEPEVPGTTTPPTTGPDTEETS